jgi:cytochrome P450
MTSAAVDDLYYDPYRADINADPYPTFKRLRDDAPIYYNDRYDFWALSRHEDVDKALVNWQTFSNSRSSILELIQSGIELPSGVVLFEDPLARPRSRHPPRLHQADDATAEREG